MRRHFQILSFFLFAGLQVHAASSSELGTFVALGDSLTAGFQNFSLYTSEVALPSLPPAAIGGQEHGYAQLIAKQAGTDLRNPTVVYPGIPPALITVSDGSLENQSHIQRSPGMGGRLNPGSQTLNFSVPSYTVADALGRQVDLLQLLTNPVAADPQDVLAFTVLGLPNACGSQIPPASGAFSLPSAKVTLSAVDCAVKADPDTILLSLGSNDALQALTFGTAPTPPNAFKASFHQLMTQLKRTHARIMVANVADITQTPYLWTQERFQARCGYLPNTQDGRDYVVPNFVDPNATGDVCDPDGYVSRSADLVNRVRAMTVAYNGVIKGEANAANAVVLDIAGLVADISANGIVIGQEHLTADFGGGLYSDDGMHPSNIGYAIMANKAIQTMNNAWGTSIPYVDLEQVPHRPSIPGNNQ